jgi:hypothetical protein
VVIADALFQAGGMPTITIARLASRSSTPMPETTAMPECGAPKSPDAIRLLRKRSEAFFEVPAVFYLLFSGGLALAGPEEVGGIAWWAHIGGFLAGMLLCGLFVKRPAPRRMQPDEYGMEWAWDPRRR